MRGRAQDVGMAPSGQRPSRHRTREDPPRYDEATRRRNRWLAIILGLVALAFYLGLLWHGGVIG